MDYYKEGEQFYLNNEYMKALKCFKLNYDNGYSNDTLNYIACCYINLGNFIEAKKTLMELIMRTNWERPLFNLGRVYLMEEDYNNERIVIKNNTNIENTANILCLNMVNQIAGKEAVSVFNKIKDDLNLLEFEPFTKGIVMALVSGCIVKLDL